MENLIDLSILFEIAALIVTRHFYFFILFSDMSSFSLFLYNMLKILDRRTDLYLTGLSTSVSNIIYVFDKLFRINSNNALMGAFLLSYNNIP